MLRRLAKLAVALALASSIGLHWAFLQSVAWVGMVVTYSQDAPLKDALVKTFDGKHPCALCKEIDKSKQSEKKSESPSVKKLDLLVAGTRLVVTASARFCQATAPLQFPALIFVRPPVPPPRGFFA